jgi:hypothetical protein
MSPGDGTVVAIPEVGGLAGRHVLIGEAIDLLAGNASRTPTAAAIHVCFKAVQDLRQSFVPTPIIDVACQGSR